MCQCICFVTCQGGGFSSEARLMSSSDKAYVKPFLSSMYNSFRTHSNHLFPICQRKKKGELQNVRNGDGTDFLIFFFFSSIQDDV